MEALQLRRIKNNAVYCFLFNSNVHESDDGLVSIHRTEKGARAAMNDHKAKCLKEFDKLMEILPDWEDKDDWVFGSNQSWGVLKMEIKD